MSFCKGKALVGLDPSGMVEISCKCECTHQSGAGRGLFDEVVNAKKRMANWQIINVEIFVEEFTFGTRNAKTLVLVFGTRNGIAKSTIGVITKAMAIGGSVQILSSPCKPCDEWGGSQSCLTHANDVTVGCTGFCLSSCLLTGPGYGECITLCLAACSAGCVASYTYCRTSCPNP